MSKEIQPNPEHSGLIPRRSDKLFRTDAIVPVWKRVLTFNMARPDRNKIDGVLTEEREKLLQDLETKGLLGEHPLVKATMMREPTSQSHGNIHGNILWFEGQHDASSEHKSRVAFAWQRPNGTMIFSEVPLDTVQIVVDDSHRLTTVEFQFEESRLVQEFHEVFLDGAVYRYSSENPNGYIQTGLASAVFTTPQEEYLQDFLRIPPKKE
jgi:hypothetical protein